MSLSLSLAASNVLLHSPLLGPAISVAGLRFCRSAPPHLWLRGASTPSIKLNLPFSSSALQVNLSHRQYFCPPLQNKFRLCSQPHHISASTFAGRRLKRDSHLSPIFSQTRSYHFTNTAARMAPANDPNYVVNMIKQSPPIDVTAYYDPAWVTGKTIIITGGASGFGAAFARHWATHGANIIVSDISVAAGETLVEELRKETSNPNHHFVKCDVTNWQSQVDLFKTAVKLSPNKAIDAVVANAGISGLPGFDRPEGLDAEEPPEPNYKVVGINLKGVMYTTQLAIFWLKKNNAPRASPDRKPGNGYTPDRHILLVGSIASLAPIPGLIEYGISKHAVLGLFRSLRAGALTSGIRINMICPYFIDTPIIPVNARLTLAGGAMGRPEDVTDAATRLMADTRIVGRALCVGPKVRRDDDWQLLPSDSTEGVESGIWEVYADDFVEVEAFTRRFVGLLNQVERVRGWGGFIGDVVRAFLYPLGIWQKK